MSQYFRYDYTGQSFILFSPQHLFVMAVIGLFTLILILFRKKLRDGKANRWFRTLLAIVLIASELSLTLWFLLTGEWSAAYSLPLHLCSLSLILSVFMLFTNSYSLFEFVYFAGLGGALQAILTPDLGPYSFPHFRAIQFFVAHGAVVLACFFMIFVEKYKPSLKSIFRAWIWLNLYALFVSIVNRVTGGNYLFLAGKPENPSLLDFLGPWPWYILSLEGVAISMFFLFYLPFWVYNGLRQLSKRKTTHVSPPFS